MNASAVDLFCGAGGLTHGLEQADIEVNAGIDLDPECEYPYEANNDAKFLEEDINHLPPEKIEDLYPEGDMNILAGCAPCQPFSQFTQGNDAKNNTKWELLYSFAELVDSIEPPIVTMENVPQVTKYEVFDDFVKKLNSLDYSVWYDVIHTAQYGVPQDRKRLVLLASKLGDLELVEPVYTDSESYRTVEDEISNLPKIDNGETHKEYNLHRAAGLRGMNTKRIKASEPGGTWKDWPKELWLECHKKESGNSYVGVYGRMEWEEPAPTITTQFYNYGSGRFGHPEQNRAISIREGAMLQSFPKEYEFEPEDDQLSNDVAGRLIGNAVPVKLAKAIGESIKYHLQENQEETQKLAAA